MSYIDSYPLQHSTIMRLYSEKDEILMDPDYQRLGGIWTPEKKQLLIDSILNNYDIPKIYLHAFSRDQRKSASYAYAVIDGRQRLETIWDFIECKFALSEDFVYQEDPTVKLASLSYSDMASKYPKIKIKFDSFVLPVVGVETDDQDLIEDMFSRLNEAVPLNAAEKRNAFGGDLIIAVRGIVNHKFFTTHVCFNNKRYKHHEIAARFMLIEWALFKTGKIIDTKKEYLDLFAKQLKHDGTGFVDSAKNTVSGVLDYMSSIFMEKDDLLRLQGNMTLYYLLSKSCLATSNINALTRSSLLEFTRKVHRNRQLASHDYAESSFELLEYDRLTQQGTNDSSNIRSRLSVICEHLGVTPIIE